MKTLLFISLLCGAVNVDGDNAETEKNAEEVKMVHQAARAFRIQTYERFRLHRHIYDARRQAGDQLLKHWEGSLNRDEYVDDVRGWFEFATRDAQLPEMPVWLEDEVIAQKEQAADELASTSTEDEGGTEATGETEQAPADGIASGLGIFSNLGEALLKAATGTPKEPQSESIEQLPVLSTP